MQPLRKPWLVALLLPALLFSSRPLAVVPTPTSTAGATKTPAGTAVTVVPVITSTPRPDGSVIHVVQPGQALWSIASAYQVSLADLYALNGMTERTVIYPGDKLLVIGGQVQPTLDATATLSATLVMDSATPTLPPTRRPTRTLAPAGLTQPVPPGSPTAALSAALAAGTPAPREQPVARIDPLLAVIGALVLLGCAFVLFGTVLRKG